MIPNCSISDAGPVRRSLMCVATIVGVRSSGPGSCTCSILSRHPHIIGTRQISGMVIFPFPVGFDVSVPLATDYGPSRRCTRARAATHFTLRLAPPRTSPCGVFIRACLDVGLDSDHLIIERRRRPAIYLSTREIEAAILEHFRFLKFIHRILYMWGFKGGTVQ